MQPKKLTLTTYVNPIFRQVKLENYNMTGISVLFRFHATLGKYFLKTNVCVLTIILQQRNNIQPMNIQCCAPYLNTIPDYHSQWEFGLLNLAVISKTITKL